MSTKHSQHSRLLKELGLDSMKPLEPLLPPVFPTLQELAMEQEIAARTPPTRQRLLDLFDGTLGDLAPLLEDFSLHPEKYGADQTQLLQQLESGSTSLELLNPNQRLVLNLAVLDFNSPVPFVESPQLPKTASGSSSDEDEEYSTEEESEEYKHKEPEAQSDEMPETELPTHWWLSGSSEG